MEQELREEPKTNFGRIAIWSLKNRKLTVAIITVLTVVSLMLALTLKVDSSTLKLLPKDSPATLALNELNEIEGGVTTLSITVGGGSEDDQHVYLEEIGTKLEALPDIQYTYHEMDQSLIWKVGLLQLSPTELSEIRDRLKGVIALGPAASNPFVASRLMSLGPLTERLKTASYKARMAPSEGMSRLIVRPNGQATDLPFARKIMAEIDEVISEVEAPKGVEVLWIGGGYRHNVEDYEGIIQDVKWTSLGALAMVFLTIAIGFRSPRAIFLIFTPLVIGNIWALGFAKLTVGSLNTFTSFISAVLLGMGIDFGIHLYSRFREERLTGLDTETSIVRAWDKVGRPTFVTAATASSGFLALLIGSFRGFSQLGLLLGAGVIFCLLLVFWLMPLLITWTSIKNIPEPRFKRDNSGHNYRFAPIGLLASLLVVGVGAYQSSKLGFQFDLSELRRDGMAFNDLDETKQALARDSYSPLVVSYPDEDSLKKGFLDIQKDVATGKLPEIKTVLSIYSVIPVDQEKRLEILREIAELTKHENSKYLPAVVLENLKIMSNTDIKPLTIDDLPPSLVHILGGGVGQHRMLLLASGNMWSLRDTAHLNKVIYRRFADPALTSLLDGVDNAIVEQLTSAPDVGFVTCGKRELGKDNAQFDQEIPLELSDCSSIVGQVEIVSIWPEPKKHLTKQQISAEPPYRIDVNLPQDGMLTFKEMNAPGWVATIDEKPAQLFNINYGLQYGLLVPAGHHSIVLKYKTSPAGEYLCLGSLYDVMKTDMPRIIVLAFVMVFLATLLDVKKPLQSLAVVGVLLSGMLLAGASLTFFKIQLSIVNIVGIPILLGLGVAVIIHLLHRIRREGPGQIKYSLSTTGWAAALCTTTTVLSFAALSFAGSQGVRSLGLLVVVGLTVVTITAFILVPLGWAALWNRKS